MLLILGHKLFNVITVILNVTINNYTFKLVKSILNILINVKDKIILKVNLLYCICYFCIINRYNFYF